MSDVSGTVHPPTDDTAGSTPDRLGAQRSAALLEAVGDATALVEQMRRALDSRAVIEQAKGVLMERRGCDAESALAELVRRSQDGDVKVRDIAADLVDEVSASRRMVGRSG